MGCKQSGFTLLELMTVILIMGLSVGLVLPSFDKILEQNKEKEEFRQISQTFYSLSSYAFTSQQTITVALKGSTMRASTSVKEILNKDFLYVSFLDDAILVYKNGSFSSKKVKLNTIRNNKDTQLVLYGISNRLNNEN